MVVVVVVPPATRVAVGGGGGASWLAAALLCLGGLRLVEVAGPAVGVVVRDLALHLQLTPPGTRQAGREADGAAAPR